MAVIVQAKLRERSVFYSWVRECIKIDQILQECKMDLLTSSCIPARTNSPHLSELAVK